MPSPGKIFGLIITGMAIIFQSCAKGDDTGREKYIPTPYHLEIPPFFPTQVYIPDDNPLTVEGVELGRYLFYEGRIAGRNHPDSLMSCATCHLQEYSFSHSSGFGLGIDGKTQTAHAVMPLINLLWNPNTLLWNGRVSRLEDLTWMGIMAPHEMNSDTLRAVAMIQSIELYPPMFEKAFGTPQVTAERMGKAIAQFIRTLISSDTKFDRYLRGEEDLSPAEFMGYILFTTEEGADCFHCHGGGGNILFTTNQFYNNALDSDFTGHRDRYSVTGDPKDIGAYKAPTLRNALLRRSFMHDARFSTPGQVIDFYSQGLVWSEHAHPLMHKLPEGGARLTPLEKQYLMAFLETLTDTVFLNNPDYSDPHKK